VARRRIGIFAVSLVTAVLAAACGAKTVPAGSRVVTVDAHQVAGLGTVLVTTSGFVVYMFAPDHQGRVTCTGSCAGIWPPLRLARGGEISTGPGVNRALVSTEPDPEGGQVVTYNGCLFTPTRLTPCHTKQPARRST
jgi:hypothetical protein